MKLPSKILYAYRAVAELALQYNHRTPVQIHAISKAQNIPEKFLVQILIRLKNAGILVSTRGVSGGYRLARDPARVTLADVFRAVDTTIISAEDHQSRTRVDSQRILNALWGQINSDLVQQLEAVTFASIIHQFQHQGVSYSI